MNLLNDYGSTRDVYNSSGTKTGTVTFDITTRGNKLIDLINDEQFDVIGFQEVGPKLTYDMWTGTEIESRTESGSWKGWFKGGALAGAPGYAWIDAVGGSFFEDETNEGNIVVYNSSKLSVIETGKFWLASGAPEVKPGSGYWERKDRICCWVLFEDNETGIKFIFSNTHFDNLADSQLQSAKAVRAKLKAIASAKGAVEVILVGDFNAAFYSGAYKEFNSNGYRDASAVAPAESTVAPECITCTGKLYSGLSSFLTQSPSEHDDKGNPKYNNHIDFIFCTNGIDVESYRMIGTASNLGNLGVGMDYSYISDHNAIIAELSVNKLPA